MPNGSRLLACAVPIAGALLLTAPPAEAQPIALGPEFQVNVWTTGDQKLPGAAMDAAGNFVIVWDSDGQDGSGRGIFGRRFDRDGGPLGAEFQVNVSTGPDQYPAEAAMSPGGEFVVVWNSFGQDGDGRGVFARLFDSTGAPRGGEFQVNTNTASNQYRHTAEMAPDGSFVIAWNSLTGDGSGYGIFARRFGSDGVPIDAQEFQVNTYTTGSQQFPKIDMNTRGEYVIAWETDGPDGDGDGVAARRFDLLSGPIDAGEIQINAWTTLAQRVPGVAIQENGDFVVVWKSDLQDGSQYGVFGRRFDSTGAPLDAQDFQVNTYTTNSQNEPWVTLDSSGAFVVTWEGLGDVDGRRFGPDGVPLEAGQFPISQNLAGFATLAGGRGTRFVSAWRVPGDGWGAGVFARLFSCDTDDDGLCDRFDVVLTHPLDKQVLDCSDPAASQPTFTWSEGVYDRFKVYMGSSPGFEKGTRVTSGKKKIHAGAWTPSRKKWKRACRKALAADPVNGALYIQVRGKDRDVPRNDPYRVTSSQRVVVVTAP